LGSFCGTAKISWKIRRLRRLHFSLGYISRSICLVPLNYSAAIQPYALKLFFALLLIEIIVTWIQYSAEGQVDPSFFLGRMIKHILSGGFIYLMI